MKRKAYLAALVMCMALAVNGCGNNKSEADSSDAQATEQEADTLSSKTDSEGNTRLVSVDSVEKYVTIADYKGITLDNTVQEVTDTDIDNRVAENLQNKSETVNDADAVIQNGDTATINFVGTKDGEAFEGGTANNYDLVIGSGTMIPGFEEGIVGMKKGETKDVTVTFPESYRSSDLAGQEAVFQITVQSFKRPPELTDDWVTANTDYQNTDEYKESVRSELEQENNSLRSTAWNTVYTNSEVVEYPEEDVNDAVETFKKQAEAYAKQADMTLDEFVESQGISQDDFDEQCQQYAQGKVKQNLIVQGIMDTEGLSLDDKESLKIQNDLVEQMGASDLAELVDTYGQDYVDESVGLLRVEDFIISNANVSEKVALGDVVGEDAEAAANQAAALDQNENSDGEADVTEDSEVTLNDGTETEEAEEVLDESEGSDGSGDGEDADLEEELGAEDGDETVDAGE